MSILGSSNANYASIDPQNIHLENSSSLISIIKHFEIEDHEQETVTNTLIKFLQQETSLVWIIFGTIGNILSLFVLLRRKMRIHSTFTYLTILAICDTLVLYFGLLRDFLVNKYNLDLNGDILCKFHVFSFYFVLHMASWLLVAVNIDRLIAASFLSLSKKWCTPKTAIKVSIYLAIFLMIINSHFLYFVDSKGYQVYEPEIAQKPRNSTIRANKTNSENNSSIIELKFRGNSYSWLMDVSDQLIDLNGHYLKNQIGVTKNSKAQDEPVNRYVYKKCLIKPNSPVYSYFFSNIFTWIDASAQVILPFIIMLICNINIIHKVLLTKNKSNGKNLKRVRKIRGMCIMIVSVSVLFLVLEAPILLFICLMQGSYIQPTWPYIELFWTIMNLMMYTNHVINFLSYCMTGTKFRRELLRLLCIHSFLKHLDNYRNMIIAQNDQDLKNCHLKSAKEKNTIVRFFKRNQELNFVTEPIVKNKNSTVKPVNLTAGILNKKKFLERVSLKKEVDKESDSELCNLMNSPIILEKNIIDSIRTDNKKNSFEEISATKSFSKFGFQNFRRKSKKNDPERIQLDDLDIELDEESGYF